jgi:hypothetical protein
MRLVLGIAAVAAVASTACATMAHGPQQRVTVTSEPSGAQVTVLSDPPKGERRVRSNPGATPLKLDLARRDRNLVVRIEKEGCRPAEVRLKRTVSGWTMANLMAANPYNAQGLNSASDYPAMAVQGLAVGFGIDFLSGAAFEFPRRVDVTLEGCR